MPTILNAAAVTPTPVSVAWNDVAQGVVNQIIDSFNQTVPVVLTLLGLSIAFRCTIRLIKRFARV